MTDPAENRLSSDTETVNTAWLAAAVLVVSLQVLIAVVFIYSFFPIPLRPFAQTMFPAPRAGLQPEREMVFYRIFIFVALALQAGALVAFRRRLSNMAWRAQLKSFFGTEAVILFIQLFAVFKMITGDNPSWARAVFYAGLGLAALNKIFWTEIRDGMRRLYASLLPKAVPFVWVLAADAVFVIFMALCILTPDWDAALSRVFLADAFYHYDSLIMSPGWAYLAGNVLRVDTISQYSVLIPMIFSRLAEWIGGFSYRHVLMLLEGATIIYLGMAYGLLRFWLRDALLAAVAFLLLIKLQMFHPGVDPIIWHVPSASVVRYFFDIPFLFCLLFHLRRPNHGFLWGATALAGFSTAYMIDTGIYMTLTLYAYLVLHGAVPSLRRYIFAGRGDWGRIAGYVVLPPVIAAGTLWIFQGQALFHPHYWANTFEFSGFFLQGWGALPVYDGLSGKNFFAFIMGLTIPVIYVMTMTLVGALCWLDRMKRENIFVVVLCVYGLGLYHYFICRSAVTSYYVVSLPFIFILAFWTRQLVSLWPVARRRIVLAGLVVAAAAGLMTNYLFLDYPNVFNHGHFDWAPYKEFYRQEFNYDTDAALIDRLVPQGAPAVVISSFETKILMDAKRRPFFYYFPIILESRHRRTNQFGGTYLHTRPRVEQTFAQLETAKPEYIFVEKKLYLGQIPGVYYQKFQTLTMLIQYLLEHYEPYENGEYLMALKRKG